MSAEQFAKLNLNQKQIAECLKKPKLTQELGLVIKESGTDSTDKSTGALLLSLAQASAKDDALSSGGRSYISKAIADQRLKSNSQVEGEYDIVLYTEWF